MAGCGKPGPCIKPLLVELVRSLHKTTLGGTGAAAKFGVGTSSSADDAALNSRQGYGYKSLLDLERIPHTPGPCIKLFLVELALNSR